MITQTELKQILHYNPKSGLFTWKIKNKQKSKIKIGDIAGGFDKNGYRTIQINNKRYYAHRLAWLYMKGYIPEYQIDHKNRRPGSNHWNNLRHVTRVCNQQNKNKNIHNKSGFPGVCWSKANKNWAAQIHIDKKSIGGYSDPLEAALVRFTIEVQCPKWSCNYKSELVKAIKLVWPEFRF